MRTIGLAIFSTLFMQANAQDQYSWNLNFDFNATRSMDSLHGCWQIGAPQKTILDSAYTTPFALITDTILPYPVEEISYADFSVPVYSYGEYVVLSFRHRMDADPEEAFGWLEYFDPGFDNAWIKVGGTSDWSYGFILWSGDGLETDSTLLFPGGDSAWKYTQVVWHCLGVFQGDLQRDELPDSMRLRFSFQALANTNQRGGWMIDDIVLENYGYCSGLPTIAAPSFSIMPNPAKDRMMLDLGQEKSYPQVVELLNTFGAIVRSESIRSSRQWIDLSNIPEGMYLVRLRGDPGSRIERIIVQH